MKWMNALGLILQFASFWLAAPELLGRQTLERVENGFRKFAAALPMILMMLFIMGYGLTFGIMGVVKGMRASESGISSSEMNEYYITIGVSSVAYMIFMIYYKRIQKWIELKFAAPLTNAIIRNNESRKNALITGSVLFTVGFLMQLIVILAT
jgi:hypothetical protein